MFPCDRDLKGRIHALCSYNRLVRCAAKLVREIKPDIIHLNSTCLVGAAKVANVIAQCDRCLQLPFDPDPIGLIDAADVIIAPFTTPHSARSVFEGAAMGKPALVSNLPNLCELILDQKTGLKFNLRNDDSFLESVNKLCDREERNAQGGKAREFATEKFDQIKNVRRTIDVYQDLLEKGFES